MTAAGTTVQGPPGTQGAPPASHNGVAREVADWLTGTREYVLFLLGLVPLLLAVLRVYLITEGDAATLAAAIQTLDVRTLIMDTFARSIGVLGLGATLYVGHAAVHRHLRGPNPGRLGPVGITLLMASLVVSIASLYPEQVFGWSLWDDDLVHSILLTIAGYVGLYAAGVTIGSAYHLARIARNERRLRVAQIKPAARAALRWHSLQPKTWFASWPRVLIVVPVLVYLFWHDLLTYDRMWLPEEVIVVKTAQPALPTPSLAVTRDSLAVTRTDGTHAFLGYVLSETPTSVQLLTRDGRVLVTEPGDVVSRTVCQDERLPDQSVDVPIVVHLAPISYAPHGRASPACDDALRADHP